MKKFVVVLAVITMAVANLTGQDSPVFKTNTMAHDVPYRQLAEDKDVTWIITRDKLFYIEKENVRTFNLLPGGASLPGGVTLHNCREAVIKTYSEGTGIVRVYIKTLDQEYGTWYWHNGLDR